MAQLIITDEDVRRVIVVGGTPTTGPFSFDFFYFASTDIQVYKDGVLQTESVDYSIAPTTTHDDGFEGGAVTWLSSIDSVTLAIVMALPFGKTANFPVSGPFDVASLNTQISKLISMLQVNKADVGRAITVPVDEEPILALPAAADRASGFVTFDAGGNVSVATGVVLASVTTSIFGESLVNAANAAAAQGLLNAGTAGILVFEDETVADIRTTLDVIPDLLTSPLTTDGDILYRDGGSALAALGIGADGTQLQSDGSIPAWVQPDMEYMASLSSTISGTPGTLDIEPLAANYDYYIQFNNFGPATDDVRLCLRIKETTYLAGASDYSWAIDTNAGHTDDGADDEIQMTTSTTNQGVSNGAGRQGKGFIRLSDIGEASLKTFVSWEMLFKKNSGFTNQNRGMGERAAAAAGTGIQMFFSSGNIASGTVKVWRMRTT